MKNLTSRALALIALLFALSGCANPGSGSNANPVNMGAAGAGGVQGAAGVMAGASSAMPGTGGVAAGASGATPGTGGAATGAAGVAAGTGGAMAGTGGAGGSQPTSAGTLGTDAGQTSDAGATPDGGGGAMSSVEPIIPEISGECPTFKAGTSTATVMGISSTIIAGEKKDGTGSLVFYWYGTGGLGDVGFLPQSIKDEITAEGGIVFAQNQAKNTGGDCSGTGTFGIDDFKVSDQVAACAVKNYGINPKRIYATGCSAGGLTSGCMGIMRSNYIAAVAPNSGGVTIGYGKLQNPMHMPNAVTMNGGAADNVIVNFGNTSEGYDNYVLKYGGFAVNCIHNSGHCGAPASVYASAWRFLKDHPFGIKPEPYAGGLPSGFDPTCKVFMMTSMAPLGGF